MPKTEKLILVRHGESQWNHGSRLVTVMFAFSTVAAASSERAVLMVLAFALAVLMAWSRVCLGLHFPSDVVAGAVIGAACAWLGWKAPTSVQ